MNEAKKNLPTPREIVAPAVPDDRENYGQAMQACSPQERAFVIAVMEGKSFAAAAREAGYGKPESTAETMARIAYRVSHYARVIDAMIEESRKAIRATGPQAVSALREIVSDRYHRDRAKVSLALVEKFDPTVQRQQIDVNHKFDPIKITLEELARLKKLGATREAIMQALDFRTDFELQDWERRLGQSDIIDAEYTEITVPADDPDKDILGE